MLLVLNLPLVVIWVRLLSIPYPYLFPAIIGFCCIGILSISNNPFHVYTMIVFGLGGYLLMKLDFEPAPLLLGFVIGPMLEENLRRSFVLSDGNPLVFVQRPVAAGLLAIAVIALIVAALPSIRQRRNEAFVE
jgi:TctA family transporter